MRRLAWLLGNAVSETRRLAKRSGRLIWLNERDEYRLLLKLEDSERQSRRELGLKSLVREQDVVVEPM